MNTDNSVVARVFENAAKSFEILKKTSIDERVILIKKLQNAIVENLEEIIDVICSETGKVRTEALSSDMFPSIDTLNYFSKHLKKHLQTKTVKSSLFYNGDTCKVKYKPAGPALIIAPWNFPFLLAFVPVINAIAAGCSVILKPSDITPKTGEMIEKMFQKAGFPQYSVQCIYGGAETVQSAIRQKPARVLFTGSTKTGREIGKLCGELLIPAVLELGGKAPAIICDDADPVRTANAVIYGAFINNGQICVAMSRVLVGSKIKEKFTEELLSRVKNILLNRDYGKLAQPERIPYLEGLIEDAVSKGARVIFKGGKSDEFLSPVILDDVTPEMRIFNEECFAPVLCLRTFVTEAQAVEFANKTCYGLAASVWSKDLKRAEKIAESVDAGSIGVNEWIKGVADPSLPFGGMKDSGMGRYHCDEGVQFFSDKISVLISKSKNASEVNWLPYEPEMYNDFKIVIMFFSELRRWE